MCLEMDSRKWKILGFFIRHTEGGGVRGPGDICQLSHFFFFFWSLPLIGKQKISLKKQKIDLQKLKWNHG